MYTHWKYTHDCMLAWYYGLPDFDGGGENAMGGGEKGQPERERERERNIMDCFTLTLFYPPTYSIMKQVSV